MTGASLEAGARVGPYEVLALLGQGGMGAVYRAKDLRLFREVALKILLTDVPCDKDRLARFEDEAKAASLLSHPNIVAVYDIGESAGSPYIVSELLQGQTLRDRLSTGSLPARKVVDYGTQIHRSCGPINASSGAVRPSRGPSAGIRPDDGRASNTTSRQRTVRPGPVIPIPGTAAATAVNRDATSTCSTWPASSPPRGSLRPHS